MIFLDSRCIKVGGNQQVSRSLNFAQRNFCAKFARKNSNIRALIENLNCADQIHCALIRMALYCVDPTGAGLE